MNFIKFLAVVVIFVFPAVAIAQSPNDPLLDRLWYLDQIHAQDAWETTTGDSGVIVAIIDTGVDLDHPDLAGNIWVNNDEIAGDALDNDGNGYIDDVNGWDFVDNDANPTPVDAIPFDVSAVTHGTLVAGIISAVGNNMEGIAGVSWDAKLMPLRILDRTGSGTERAAIEAIDYAVENGADVINLSFTGRDIGQSFVMSVKRAYEHGVVFVAAVGNDGRTGLANLNSDPVYPACLKGVTGDDWVIGVASTTQLDEKADFSNYGRSCTDIAAPGVDMFGAYFQNSGNPYFQNYYGGYWQGTSASTPVVSGAAALLLSRFPSLTPAKVKTILQLAADPVVSRGTPWFGQLGSGRLNIARAIEIAPAFAPPVIRGETRTPVLFAAGQGHQPEVNIFNADGTHDASYLVYDSKFTGGVSALVDDLDHDGNAEFAVIPRSGGSAHVRWFELDGTLRGQFVAFNGKLGGFSIASGDPDADGNTEIVVASRDGEPRLQVYDISGGLERELAIETNQGYTIKLGDVDGVVGDEIVLAPISGAPAVTILRGDGSPLNTIAVSAPSQTMGINLALGDIDDNGRKEILVGLKGGGAEQVRGFTYQGALVQSFFIGEETSLNGAKVSVGDIDGDGNDDVFAISDKGSKEMKVYKNQKLDRTWSVSDVIIGDTELVTWTF